MQTIDQADVAGKKVIVRADFDVPIEFGMQNGESTISDRTRIEKNIPTLKLLRSKGAQLFIISHLGRPEGIDSKFSLKIVLPILEELVGEKVNFQENLETKVDGDIVLLENLRFWPEEEENGLEFAKKLASFGETYVNEAFSVDHRTHASVSALPSLLPSYAGLELAKEINELETIFKAPKHPLVAIIGGAKIETKLPAISNLAKIANKVLVGGRLMFEIDKNNLSENVIVASDNVDGKDIGPTSLEIFAQVIKDAQMIVWNGPMGVYEDEKYRVGTLELAKMIAVSGAYKIVGGGDTISALDELKLTDKMDFVSVGGGAMLEFLGGKKLPALEALGYYVSL